MWLEDDRESLGDIDLRDAPDTVEERLEVPDYGDPTEDEVLEVFWRRAERANRWQRRFLLRRFVGIQVAGPREKRGRVTDDHRKAARRGSYRCWACERQYASEIHHIIAVKCGGTTVLANLVSLCVDCHDRVHSRHPERYDDVLLRTDDATD